MKNHSASFLALILLWFALSSCKTAAPTFRTVDNIRFEHLGLKGLKLGADAEFHNPNRIKCKIVKIEMNVVLDDRLIGILGEKADVVIKRKSDFTVPLGILIKPEGTVLEDIKTFYKILTDRPAELYLVGFLRVKLLGIKFTVPVKYRQTLKRSDFKN
jgi:hypothetical protein